MYWYGHVPMLLLFGFMAIGSILAVILEGYVMRLQDWLWVITDISIVIELHIADQSITGKKCDCPSKEFSLVSNIIHHRMTCPLKYPNLLLL
jgi:hypothetical protein